MASHPDRGGRSLILWSGFLKSAVIVARNRKRARLKRLL